MKKLSYRGARLVAIAVVLASLAGGLAAAPRAPRKHTADLNSIRAAGLQIKAVYRAKRPKQPGDWLESHPEAGQTFDQYRASHPNRPDGRLTTIYIQPIGEFSATQQQIVERAKELLGLYYGMPVTTRAAVPLASIPQAARRTDPAIGHQQLLTTYVLGKLLPPRRPQNAVAVLGLTATDLWPGEGWNFVFGQGALRERVGIYSLSRYGDSTADEAQYRLCLRRTLKVAAHETGHMLGIPHCTAYECGMNGSNNLVELDRNLLGFCPECEQKIWWACGLDLRRRYASLVNFARDNKLPDEERLWEASLERLSGEARR